jgi:hypothetical protein
MYRILSKQKGKDKIDTTLSGLLSSITISLSKYLKQANKRRVSTKFEVPTYQNPSLIRTLKLIARIFIHRERMPTVGLDGAAWLRRDPAIAIVVS